MNADKLTATIARAKREVLADIAAGTVPQSVRAFAELHDYVDANYYGGAFETEFDGSETACNFWNAVQNAVDAWLKAGRSETKFLGPMDDLTTDTAAMGGGPW